MVLIFVYIFELEGYRGAANVTVTAHGCTQAVNLVQILLRFTKVLAQASPRYGGLSRGQSLDLESAWREIPAHNGSDTLQRPSGLDRL